MLVKLDRRDPPTRAASTRRNVPRTLGSKRTSFVASVPTTTTSPEAGFTAIAMQTFIRRRTYFTSSDFASITATSLSERSHPVGLPDAPALAPLTKLCQSTPLSSIQRPRSSFFTIKLTRGATALAGLIGGSKATPALGGGFTPP